MSILRDDFVEISLPYGYAPMKLRHEHFEFNLSRDKAAALFKDSVKSIEIGISSYCNRTCCYCPNSIFDRKSTKNFMSDSIFLNIISQLGEIDYREKIALHRYNEPLADIEYGLLRTSQVRSILPRAYIQIHSNGDFLDKKLIQRLTAVGVNHLDVTTHAMKNDKNFEDIKVRLEKRLKKFGMPFHYGEDSNFCRTAIIETGTAMTIHWSAKNLFDFPLDRGQTFKLPVNFFRIDPCRIPFMELQIEWDGRVVPCCNIYLDNPNHKEFVLGKIQADTDLFELWTNKKFVAWRKRLLNYELKQKPCANCGYGHIEDTPELRTLISEARRLMIDEKPEITVTNSPERAVT